MESEQRELYELIDGFVAGTLDEARFQRLTEVLRGSEAARTLYIEYMDLHAYLHWWRQTSSTDRDSRKQNQPAATAEQRAAVLEGLRQSLGLGGAMPPLPPLSGSQPATCSAPRDGRSPSRNVFSPFGIDWGFGWAGAVVGVLMVAAGLWFGAARWYAAPAAGEPRQVAVGLPKEAPQRTEEDFVARIVSVSDDLQWDDHSAPVDFLLRVRPHQSVQITNGLLQLDFASGAQFILQGPAEFTPTSSTTSYLAEGRLTTNEIKGDFKLSTEAAEVVNLGASFGVSVDEEEGTDIVVFKGRVQAKSYPLRSDAIEVVNLDEASAVRMRTDGTADYDCHPDESAFVCSIDRTGVPFNSTELSLVDVVCGGSGQDYRLSGAINPETGLPDAFRDWPTNWRYVKGTAEGFPKTDWNPLIDGVFTPDEFGGLVEIDSLHRRVMLPETCGSYFGPIWARRWDSKIPESMKGVTLKGWGQWPKTLVNNRLEESRVGIVSLHPNVGITFDLQAVRDKYHRPASSFRAILANFGNVRKVRPEFVRKVEFHVFVDGVLKYHCSDFTGIEGEEDILVPLSNHDQRLTLVSTDGHDRIGRDYLVLIDPVLTLRTDRRGELNKRD